MPKFQNPFKKKLYLFATRRAKCIYSTLQSAVLINLLLLHLQYDGHIDGKIFSSLEFPVKYCISAKTVKLCWYTLIILFILRLHIIRVRPSFRLGPSAAGNIRN